jgi:hypothetical protein
MVNGNLAKLIRCIWNMKEDIMSRFGKVAANLMEMKDEEGNMR